MKITKCTYCIICLFAALSCSLDDQYHYVYIYQVTNEFNQDVSGSLVKRETYGGYSFPFAASQGETIELSAEDGGDGPNETPIGTGIWKWDSLTFNVENQVFSISAEESKWVYTTNKNVGYYTLFLSDDLIPEE